MKKTSSIIAIATALGAFAWAAPARAQQVTYAKDVAPIMQRNCQECHPPDQVPRMSLLPFEPTRPRATTARRPAVYAASRWSPPTSPCSFASTI